MSSFDKFMKRIEEQEKLRKQRQEVLKRDDEAHNIRDRVRRYQEYWANRVVWNRGQKK